MAKNISLLGADYPDVPAVQLPQTGGGTATFYDINVVDNLNSDSSTDALSAKQGKVLDGKITKLNDTHYDAITGGSVTANGNIRIITMADANAEIPMAGIELIDVADYATLRSMCKYYDGSADVVGFLKIETSGGKTKLFVTNMSGTKVSAKYVSGQLVYTASRYNG